MERRRKHEGIKGAKLPSQLFLLLLLSLLASLTTFVVIYCLVFSWTESEKDSSKNYSICDERERKHGEKKVEPQQWRFESWRNGNATANYSSNRVKVHDVQYFITYTHAHVIIYFYSMN
jgi:hypothetical protein